jgi:small-conductance mechanosensitive channel
MIEWLDVSRHAPAWLATLIRIALVLALAAAAVGAARRIVRGVQTRLAGRDGGARVATVARVLSYVSSTVIATLAASLVLGELGISVAPLVATASVAGVALGFGAQSLVKDYLGGLLLLLEDQLREGDVVRVAGVAGLVEEVTLRYVKLRDLEGKVMFVPHGEIKVVENLTRGFAQPVIDVGVSYDADIDEVLTALREVLDAAHADGALEGRLIGTPEILGVEELGASSVTLRARVKVIPPLEQWNVRRELLRRVKVGFAARGIVIPYPQLDVHTRGASAPVGGERTDTSG